MSPRASGPIHLRSCLEVVGGALTGVTGFGGATSGEDMGAVASLRAENEILQCLASHLCERLAVMTKRVHRDEEASGHVAHLVAPIPVPHSFSTPTPPIPAHLSV